MKKLRKVYVQVLIPLFLKDIFLKKAEEMDISLSNYISILIIKNISKIDILNKNEKKLIEILKIERETEIIKYIRSKSAERLNFMKNIKKQIYNFCQNKRYLNKKELIKNMKLNLEIAQKNKWKEEAKDIKKFLSDINNITYNIGKADNNFISYEPNEYINELMEKEKNGKKNI